MVVDVQDKIIAAVENITQANIVFQLEKYCMSIGEVPYVN
jgi:hypothetical protein